MILAPQNGHYFSPTEWKRLERILSASFYLIRNDERARCKHCGAKHAYYSRNCIERPFTWFDLQRFHSQVRVSNSERPTLLPDLPDLAAHHPRTARELKPDGVGEDVLAFVLGTAEPITVAKARVLQERIRARSRSVAYRRPRLTRPHFLSQVR